MNPMAGRAMGGRGRGASAGRGISPVSGSGRGMTPDGGPDRSLGGGRGTPSSPVNSPLGGLASSTGGESVGTIKAENIAGCKKITPDEVKALVIKYKALGDNVERLKALDIDKQEYTFLSSNVLEIMGMNNSIKTKLAIVSSLAPRLMDPNSRLKDFVDVFPYATEKERVQEILKTRITQLASKRFASGVNALSPLGNLSPSGGVGAGGALRRKSSAISGGPSMIISPSFKDLKSGASPFGRLTPSAGSGDSSGEASPFSGVRRGSTMSMSMGMRNRSPIVAASPARPTTTLASAKDINIDNDDEEGLGDDSPRRSSISRRKSRSGSIHSSGKHSSAIIGMDSPDVEDGEGSPHNSTRRRSLSHADLTGLVVVSQEEVVALEVAADERRASRRRSGTTSSVESTTTTISSSSSVAAVAVIATPSDNLLSDMSFEMDTADVKKGATGNSNSSSNSVSTASISDNNNSSNTASKTPFGIDPNSAPTSATNIEVDDVGIDDERERKRNSPRSLMKISGKPVPRSLSTDASPASLKIPAGGEKQFGEIPPFHTEAVAEVTTIVETANNGEVAPALESCSKEDSDDSDESDSEEEPSRAIDGLDLYTTETSMRGSMQRASINYNLDDFSGRDSLSGLHDVDFGGVAKRRASHRASMDADERIEEKAQVSQPTPTRTAKLSSLVHHASVPESKIDLKQIEKMPKQPLQPIVKKISLSSANYDSPKPNHISQPISEPQLRTVPLHKNLVASTNEDIAGAGAGATRRASASIAQKYGLRKLPPPELISVRVSKVSRLQIEKLACKADFTDDSSSEDSDNNEELLVNSATGKRFSFIAGTGSAKTTKGTEAMRAKLENLEEDNSDSSGDAAATLGGGGGDVTEMQENVPVPVTESEIDSTARPAPVLEVTIEMMPELEKEKEAESFELPTPTSTLTSTLTQESGCGERDSIPDLDMTLRQSFLAPSSGGASAAAKLFRPQSENNEKTRSSSTSAPIAGAGTTDKVAGEDTSAVEAVKMIMAKQGRKHFETRPAEESLGEHPTTKMLIYSYIELVRQNIVKTKVNVGVGSQMATAIQQHKLEEHLSDEEFQNVFAMTREAFDKLPSWKKISQKKALLLF